MGNIAFKDKLEQLRLALGLTKSELAQRIGVSKATMSSYYVSSAIPSYTTLVNLLNEFPNVSAEWLFRNKGNMMLDGSGEEMHPEAEPSVSVATPTPYPAITDIIPAEVSEKETVIKDEERALSSLEARIYKHEYAWLKERFAELSDNYSKLQSAYIKATSS